VEGALLVDQLELLLVREGGLRGFDQLYQVRLLADELHHLRLESFEVNQREHKIEVQILEEVGDR